MGEAGLPDPTPTSSSKGEETSARLKRPELRQYTRFRMEEATVHLHIKGLLTSIGLGIKNEAKSTVNLSEGGILVITQSRLKPGTPVRIKIDIEKYKDKIEAKGEVRWSFQSARDAHDFYSGIEFRDLSPAHAALIGKMRAWFTSPEYKQKSATRRRLAPPEFQL